MATVSQAVKVFSIEAGMSEMYVRQIARDLLNHDELPRSAGKRIEPINEVGASKLLLAVYTATPITRIADATERARQYYRLTWDGEPDGLMFGDFLALAFRTIGDDRVRRVIINDQISVPFDVLRIEIITDYPAIAVSVVEDLGGVLAFDGSIMFTEAPETAAFWPSHRPRHSVTIPGSFLFQITQGLRRMEDRAESDAESPMGRGAAIASGPIADHRFDNV
jgi:hypothetical protein